MEILEIKNSNTDDKIFYIQIFRVLKTKFRCYLLKVPYFTLLSIQEPRLVEPIKYFLLDCFSNENE